MTRVVEPILSLLFLVHISIKNLSLCIQIYLFRLQVEDPHMDENS